MDEAPQAVPSRELQWRHRGRGHHKVTMTVTF